MNLQSIADIHDEISVLMPSGIPATLYLCDDGIVVDYGMTKDTYSTDEFGNIIADGIQIFEKPSQMVIEDFNNCDHIEKQNKLDRIVKCNKDTKNRQIARGLLDRLNLGADDDKEIEKFVKNANKNEKLEIKRNKTMDIKKMNKVLESYINEISDETVNKVGQARGKEIKNAERAYNRKLKDLKTKSMEPGTRRINPINPDDIEKQRDRVTKSYDKAKNFLRLRGARDRRKEQSKNESYIVREMIGNYSTVVGTFDLFDEAQDFLMDEWYKYAEENNIDLDNEAEQQNFFSYYSLEETKNESKINEMSYRSKNSGVSLHKKVGTTNKNGVVNYRGTDVFTLKDNKVILKTGGWFTQTTKDRMNQALDEYGIGGEIKSIKGTWYYIKNGEKTEFPKSGVMEIDLNSNKNESKIDENWKDHDYQYLSVKQALNDIEDEYTRNKYLQDFEGLIKRLEHSSKNESLSEDYDDIAIYNAPENELYELSAVIRKYSNPKYEKGKYYINFYDKKNGEGNMISTSGGYQTEKEARQSMKRLRPEYVEIDSNVSVVESNRMKEAFGDTMLTDINDLDFPQALQDTVETDEEGELLTLGKVADQIKNLKDELVDELKDIKDDLKDEINDIKQDMQDEISDELSDEELADIEDIEFKDVPMEAEEPVEETEEIETEELEEKPEKEEKESDEDKEDDKEDKIEESFRKYLTKGKYEDLAQTKREVDKLTQQGKDAKEIKDTITLLVDDEKEENEAEKYAVSKLKESLLATSRNSKLNNL